MSLSDNMLSEIKLSYIGRHLQGTRVLDLGAGFCHYSRWLATQNNGLDIVAVDLLDIKDTQGFTYKKMNLEHPLEFKNNEFSTVLAFDIIEHLTDEKLLLSEMYRVCSSGGIVIGSVPHDDDDFLPRYNLTFKHRSDLTHKRYYVEDSLQAALSLAGFTNICITRQGGISPQLMAEFFPQLIRTPIKKIIGALRRIGMINTSRLSSDLFFIALKG